MRTVTAKRFLGCSELAISALLAIGWAACADDGSAPSETSATGVAGSPALSEQPRMAPTVGMATAMMAAMQGAATAGTAGVVAAGTAGSGAAGGSAGASATGVNAGAGATGVAGAAGMLAGSGGMGAAGSGGAGGGAGMSAAGAGGNASSMGGVVAADANTACGEDAQEISGIPRKQGNGNTNLRTSGEVEFVSVHSTMVVPKDPAPPRGTLFLWPGLQPLQMDREVGYGVLQPVLTWGTSCADMSNITSDHWWISGVYVGTTPGSWTNISCKAGEPMDVVTTDVLDMEMTLEGTVWMQRVTNRTNGKTVSFPYDLKGQKQQWLLHQIEVQTQTKPVDDVIFTNVVAKLSDSQPEACSPSETGMNDYFSPPRASADGKTCCISKIILRASGIMPTSPNTP